MRSLVPILFLVLFASGCRSNPIGDIERAEVDAHLVRAEEELARGEIELAIDRLSAVHALAGIRPEQRNVCEARLEAAVETWIEAVPVEADPEPLLELFRKELPANLRARLGVEAADRLLAQDRRVESYRLVRRVEETVFARYERARAGEILARAGLSLAADDGKYGLFFHYRARGVEALEFLVLTYPSNPACPEAYATLANIYEGRGDLDRAIERLEDLIVYHIDSPRAVRAEARLPELRMKRVSRDDYDRGELLLARQELEDWLVRHAGHELEPRVNGTLATCRSRLAQGDLILARYYATVDSAYGMQIHAERALAQARTAGDAELQERARALLAAVPTEDVPTAAPPPPPREEAPR